MTQTYMGSNLQWEAEMRPLYFPDTSGNFVRATNKNAVVHSDWGNVLGIVSDNYEVFQNSDLFGKIDPLVQEQVVNIENTGFLAKGERVYIQARMSQEYSVLGEQYGAFITLTNAHNGRQRAGLGVSMVRIVCENTFAMANADLIRFFHTEDGKESFLASSYIRDFVGKKMETYSRRFENLATEPFNGYRFEEFLMKLQDVEEASKIRQREKLNELFYNGVETEGKTAYDAFNAITEFNSNFSRKSAQARREYVNFGVGRKVNARALAVLEEMSYA
jgi:phage/plasmid-like protein (TIGR03299 family)